MKFRTRRTASSAWPLVFVLALAGAYLWRPASGAGEAAAPPQDLNRIESRLNQVEQRFYTIEASIRGLEQQLRLSGIAAGSGARDQEVGRLRAEVEALGRRLAEVECGLAKVDERTLAAAARQARRPAAGDPCRHDAGAPLRLSTRP